VLKNGLGGSEVLLRVDDVTVEFHGEVVVNFLGWVLVFGAFPSPVLTDDLFGFSEVAKGVGNISVHAEGWDSVVLWPVSDL